MGDALDAALKELQESGGLTASDVVPRHRRDE